MFPARPYPGLLGINSSANPDFIHNTMNTATRSFYNRVITAGGYIDDQTLVAVDRFVVRGIAKGWWSKVVEAWPFVGQNLAAGLQKLKYASASALTNNNLATSDFSQAAGMGPSSGVSNTYLASGFTPASHSVTKTSVFFGVSMCADPGACGGYALSDDPAGSGSDHAIFAYQNTGTFGIQNNSWGFDNYLPRVVALNIVSGTRKQWVDGLKFVDWSSSSSTTELSAELMLFRGERFGSVTWSWGKFGMCVFGTGMSETEASDCHLAMIEFEKSVGRKVFQGESVIIIGDSIGAGQVSSNYLYDPWATRVAYMMGLRAVNVGISSMYLRVDGATSTGVYPRRADYAAMEGKTILLEIGTNDISADPLQLSTGTSATISDFQTKLQTTLQAWIDAGKRVIYIGPNYRKPAVSSSTCCRAWNTAAAAACAACTPPVLFVDADRCFRDQSTPDTYMADNVHPNSTGHARLADFIGAAAVRGEMIREMSLDFSSMAGGASSDITGELLGLPATGSLSVRALTDDFPLGLKITCFITSANNWTIRAENLTADTIDASAIKVRLVGTR